MKVDIVPPYLTILATSAALPEAGTHPHLFLKAVGLMPTPGWSLRTDCIETSETPCRIIIRLTALSPDVVRTADLTPLPVSINLGRPAPGLHLVEIHVRNSDDEAHSLRQSFVISVADEEFESSDPLQRDAAQFDFTPEAEDDDREPQKQE